jgi:hypothetical protein
MQKLKTSEDPTQGTFEDGSALSAFLASLGLIAAAAGPAQAVPIFSDDFTRADSLTVGNGWTEVEASTDAIAIVSGEMAIGKNQDPISTQFLISTVGFEDIEFSYDWRSSGAESPDILTVSWSSDGVTFTTLATHVLISSSFANASWLLPDAAEGFPLSPSASLSMPMRETTLHG